MKSREEFLQELQQQYPRITEARLRRFLDVACRRFDDVTLIAEKIHDPHNAAALLRSADGFGVATMAVIGIDEEIENFMDSSSSAGKWVDVVRYPDITECVKSMKANGQRVYVTSLEERSQSVYDIDWTEPCAVIMGNEHAGASREAHDLADGSVYIPMVGMVQSFNVSVAGAIILSEVFRQRQMKKSHNFTERVSEAQEARVIRWVEREMAQRSSAPKEE